MDLCQPAKNTAVSKLRYTKAQLEELILVQLDNMDALQEQIRLLKGLNKDLVEMWVKLKAELDAEKKKPIPYSVPARKKQKEKQSKKTQGNSPVWKLNE